jgi:phosphate starvation-inducible protein PhoH
MIGQGVLRECLLDSDVQLVQTVGQTDTGAQDFETRVKKEISAELQVERTMRGNDKVIEQLNAALSSELTAIVQYMTHAEMCDNWGYERLGQLTKGSTE